MKTIDDVIEAINGELPGHRTRFAQWKRRKSIPRSVWPDIVKITSGRVTYKHLERIEATR